MSDFVLARVDGSFALTLPPPLRGMSRTPSLIGSSRTTLSGRRILQRTTVSRDWSLSWARLSDATFRPIEAFWLGDLHGPGPFLLADPYLPDPVLVNIVSFTDEVPLLGFHDATMVLQEV